MFDFYFQLSQKHLELRECDINHLMDFLKSTSYVSDFLIFHYTSFQKDTLNWMTRGCCLLWKVARHCLRRELRLIGRLLWAKPIEINSGLFINLLKYRILIKYYKCILNKVSDSLTSNSMHLRPISIDFVKALKVFSGSDFPHPPLWPQITIPWWESSFLLNKLSKLLGSEIFVKSEFIIYSQTNSFSAKFSCPCLSIWGL